MLIPGDGRPLQTYGNFLADGNIRRAADDLQGLGSRSDLANGEFVRIRMFLHRTHFTDDESVKGFSLILEPLDFHTEHGEPFGEFLGRETHGNKTLKPLV
jgi:hypothetical protein